MGATLWSFGPGGFTMPKYLFNFTLSPEGLQGVLAEGGTARREVIKDAIEALGGSVEANYYAFGGTDAVAICDLPNNETAVAFAAEVSASGRVAVSTTVLITPEEMDRARDKRSGWRAPGTGAG
jgi:uncharacterized protein with GYD domain